MLVRLLSSMNSAYITRLFFFVDDSFNITYLWNTIDSSSVQTVASGLNIGNSGPSSKLVLQWIRPRICYHLCLRLSPQVNCWIRSRSGWRVNSRLQREGCITPFKKTEFRGLWNTRSCITTLRSNKRSSGFKTHTFSSKLKVRRGGSRGRAMERNSWKIHWRKGEGERKRERMEFSELQNFRSRKWAS